MDLKNNIILIDGVVKTYQVDTIEVDGHKSAIKFCNTNKVYYYDSDRIQWLKSPYNLDLSNTIVYVNGKKESKIASIGLFEGKGNTYFAITYQSGFVKQCLPDEIEIRKSCIKGRSLDILAYLKECASVNTLGISEEDESSRSILSSIYSKIDFIDETTAASVYLNPQKGIKKIAVKDIIFPFGCNISQKRAVKEALTNQLSVIQGPPGTGKTQTILNIIANLLITGKSVLVVSNNNSATENVLEKLTKNGFKFLVAPLGNRENKETFISNQPTLNPELPNWLKSSKELNLSQELVTSTLEKIETLFAAQNRLVMCRQELAEIEIEKSHFVEEHSANYPEDTVTLSSSKILKLLGKLKEYANKDKNEIKGLWNRIKNAMQKLNMELRLRLMLKKNTELSVETIPEILNFIELLFYIRRKEELKKEIASLNAHLSKMDSDALMKSLTNNSMTILKAALSKRYGSKRAPISSVKDLFNSGKDVLKDYPIVLSTTFSAKTIFNSQTLFDYVIMDEASQVSVETGFLALTCANNAVIVGDTMQLPNVVTEEDESKLNYIRKRFDISDAYDAARHSFLSSVLAVNPNVPETLLREHYRCHPDIINFCNQKFYGGNLLIMTKRCENDKPLMALVTSEGKHSRGHYNQREIDAVKLELLPTLESLDSVGIIAPYNQQVEQFRTQIPELECATVHKYQGREKNTIILSVTDDEIGEFTDNANLLNVAVSRAKDCFCLVVTGNPQKQNGNIQDLLGYIKYQHGAIEHSKLSSIYDYLFSQVNEFELRSERISNFESENLTFALIEKIRNSYPEWSHIKVLCHYPLRSLLHNTSNLTEREISYAKHPSTHIDFLIFNRVTKEPLLAIETDGYSYHNESTAQSKRDRMKDNILKQIGLPLIRLSTIGHSEEEKILEALKNRH